MASASISLLTVSLARDTAEALGCRRNSELVFTIRHDSEFSGSGDEEQAHRLRSSYTLHLGLPYTDIKMVGTLLSEAVEDPTRNARYKLDAEQSAEIAQSLWLSVLPP